MRTNAKERFLAVILAGFVSMAATATDAQTFEYPTINGAIVDHCATWATDCGWGGANLFCRTQGYGQATAFERDYFPGRTWVIGSQQFCDGNFCQGFRRVTCGQAGGARFNFPTINGAIVDHCATWATDCGWGGANLFCRTQGYSQATSFERDYFPGRTWVIGSQQFCDGNFCQGFRSVDCQR